MARITPASGAVAVPELEDYEPYGARLAAIDFDMSSEEFGTPEKRLVVDWALADDPDTTVRDWVGLRLGKQQSGKVSQLRAMLNAISGKAEDTEIAWFDDESLEWSYDGKVAAEMLAEGQRVVLRGKVVERKAGGKRYKVTTYQAAKKAGQIRAQRASTPADEEEIPF